MISANTNLEPEEKVIVYLTVNLKNHKIYIGIHKTNKPEGFDGYIGCGMNRNKPSCLLKAKTPFQLAVKKYGFDAFRRVTLRICDNYEEALNIEALLVNEKFVKSEKTYNIALGGGAPGDCSISCYKYSLQGEFLAEYPSIKYAGEMLGLAFPTSISIAITNKTPCQGCLWTTEKVDKLNIDEFNISNYNNKKNIVYIYNLEGDFIKEFDSLNSAIKELGGKVADLSQAIKVGYKFRGEYYASLEKFDKYVPLKSTKHSPKDPIYQYALNGTFIKEWKNAKAVKEYFNSTKLTDSLITGKTHNGFQWSYTKLDKLPDRSAVGGRARKVGRYDDEGNLLEVFNTVSECMKTYGNASKVLKGIVEHCKGFKFKYID